MKLTKRDLLYFKGELWEEYLGTLGRLSGDWGEEPDANDPLDESEYELEFRSPTTLGKEDRDYIRLLGEAIDRVNRELSIVDNSMNVNLSK